MNELKDESAGRLSPSACAKLEELVKGSFWGKRKEIVDSEVIIREAQRQGATSLIRGGGIYDVTLVCLKSDGSLEEKEFRVKKFTDEGLYNATLEFQEELRILADEGHLEGDGFEIDVGHITAHDEGELMIVEGLVKPAIRLSDYIVQLQKVESPDVRSRLLEDITKKAVSATVEASLHSTPMGHQVGLIDRLIKEFGVIDPIKQIVTRYALRFNPELSDRLFDQHGELKKHELSDLPAIRSLVEALEQEFMPAYDRRQVNLIINRDNHTGNMLIKNPQEVLDSLAGSGASTRGLAIENIKPVSFVLTDFEQCGFGLIEDSLAELILTAGIDDKNAVKRLVSGAYNRLRGEQESNFRFAEVYKTDPVFDLDKDLTEDEFLETFSRKLTEKYLVRASRFLGHSRKMGGLETEGGLRNYDLACRAYTLALRELEAQGLHKTAEAVKAVNKEYMGLRAIEISKNPTYGFHNNLTTFMEAV